MWDLLTQDCKKSRWLFKPRDDGLVQVENYGVPFLTDVSASNDICRHQNTNLHGLPLSPTTFIALKGTIPILSSLFSVCHWQRPLSQPAYGHVTEGFAYNEESDISWEDKRDRLHFVGSTLDVRVNSVDWRVFHHQRFVALSGIKHRDQVPIPPAKARRYSSRRSRPNFPHQAIQRILYGCHPVSSRQIHHSGVVL
jgi:hypothetical protein